MRGENIMIEYKVISAEWIELAEGYGYWKYEFEKVGEKNDRSLYY